MGEIFFESDPGAASLGDIMACPRCGELLNKHLCGCQSDLDLLTVLYERYKRGESRETLLAALDQQLYIATEAEDEPIREVMDYLVGWCSSHMVLDKPEDWPRVIEFLRLRAEVAECWKHSKKGISH